jgi:uncharacterized protein YecE (DUF72 family)
VTGRLYAGTSGFSYPTWRGGFYPAAAKPAEFLRHYAGRLPSVELIATFRRMPTEEQVRSWAGQTPTGFRFAPKMTASISHGGRLALLPTFCERVRAFGERLGPIRIQLTRRRDDGFLRQLLDTLDPALGFAIDLEHESWEAAEVDEALAAARVARVGSLDGEAAFRYVRLREPPYDEAALNGWAERISPLLASGIDVYCYFKHEDDPRGALYAERLLRLVSGEA